MGVYTRSPGHFNYRSYFPPAIRWLLILNCGLFVFSFLLGLVDSKLWAALVDIFGLRATSFLKHGMLWQPVTYLFLHGGLWHVLFNMFALWMFGADLERDWGTRRFLRYYFVCGIGAGLCDVTANLAFGPDATTIGASGAIYGILLAYGLLYPNRTIFFNFLFPIPARIYVIIIGAIAFLSSLGGSSNVSNVAHLGGMLFGYLYLRLGMHYLDWGALTAQYQQWRRRRLKQKFQVYMRKRDQDPDRWVN
jgi:membrane associated rhomboid family serine protease